MSFSNDEAPALSAPPALSVQPHASRRKDLFALLLLLLLCLPWLLTLTLPFSTADDPYFISANRYMQHGLTLENVAWACTTGYGDYWHPLLWLSLQLDVTLFGFHPWAFHLTNDILHVANVFLLYFLVKKLFGGTWTSFLCAALFAIHPQRVESVAWVVERKDVLSGFFGLIALLVYLRYVRRRSAGKYLLVCAAFFLSLLAKPMLVTFPALLLLIDLLPLNRLKSERLRFVLLEKVPFLLLGVDDAVNVYLHGLTGGSYRGSLASCVQNTLLNYFHYLYQLFVPWPLIFYPHAESWIPWWRLALAELAITAISAIAVIAWRRRWPNATPLLFGWLWYLLCMLPMSGILQPGYSMRGDRFTYFPCIGLLVALLWGVLPVITPPRRQYFLAILASPVLALLLALTIDRTLLWQDNLALYEHDLQYDPDNAWLHHWAGWAAHERGLVSLERSHDVRSAALDPDSFFIRGAPIPKLPPNTPIITAAPHP